MLLPDFQTERTCTLSPCGWVRDHFPCSRKDGLQQSTGMLIRLQAASQHLDHSSWLSTATGQQFHVTCRRVPGEI